MRILFLSRWLPYPADNGSKIRIHSILKGLAERHAVTLFSFGSPAEDWDRAKDRLRQICQEVQIVPWTPFRPRSFRSLLGLATPTPRSLLNTYSKQMAGLIRDRIAAGGVDLVIASQIDTSVYRPLFGNLPSILEEVEIGVLRDNYLNARSTIERLRLRLTWEKFRRYVVRQVESFDRSTVVSEKEQGLLQAGLSDGTKIEIIPNFITVADYSEEQRLAEPGTLVFTGQFTYSPNYEAMCWFLSAVFPLILKSLPDTRLVITGDNHHHKLPMQPNIELTGYVEDVRPIVSRAAVCLAPYLTGGGTRLKVLEAMAMGKPVVATSKGVEGLDLEADRQVLIADTPQGFAAKVVRALREPAFARKIAEAAGQAVRERYDAPVVLPKLLRLVETTAG